MRIGEAIVFVVCSGRQATNCYLVFVTPLKVAVLSNGEIRLDGRPVTLEELSDAFRRAAADKAAVWYYRENAAAEAPPAAQQVMQLIIEHRLPARLSSKPDYSDSIVPPGPERAFAAIREKAAQRQLVIVRPDGRFLQLPAMAAESVPAKMLASVEGMLPSKVKRNVAVIGDTTWTTAPNPGIQTANQSIPFFGLLMGFAAIGHAVWIFGGTPSLLSAGCAQADVLIVDSALLESLPADWQSAAAKVMRNAQILVHDRATFQLRRP